MKTSIIIIFNFIFLLFLFSCQPKTVTKTDETVMVDSSFYYVQEDISDPFLDTIFSIYREIPLHTLALLNPQRTLSLPGPPSGPTPPGKFYDIGDILYRYYLEFIGFFNVMVRYYIMVLHRFVYHRGQFFGGDTIGVDAVVFVRNAVHERLDLRHVRETNDRNAAGGREYQ